VASTEKREVLRQSLEQHKQELRLAMQDLGTAARSWGDPALAIRHHPAQWLVGAFLVGVWLGRDGR
jgi:hypothetical protein